MRRDEQMRESTTICTSGGHFATLGPATDTEWEAAVALNREKGASTIANFHAAAMTAKGLQLIDKIDFAIEAPRGPFLGIIDWPGGMCCASHEPHFPQHVYVAVTSCFVTAVRRGLRFMQLPSGAISMPLNDVDWGLGDACAYIQPTLTECGMFSVLIVFSRANGGEAATE